MSILHIHSHFPPHVLTKTQTNTEVTIFAYIDIADLFLSQKNNYFSLLHSNLSFEVLQNPAFCYLCCFGYSISSSGLMTLQLLLKFLTDCTPVGQCNVYWQKACRRTPVITELDRSTCEHIKTICTGFYKISRTPTLTFKCCLAKKK